MIPDRVPRWAPWLIFVSTLVIRLSTAARFPTEWDSVQFVLGVDRFDVFVAATRSGLASLSGWPAVSGPPRCW